MGIYLKFLNSNTAEESLSKAPGTASASGMTARCLDPEEGWDGLGLKDCNKDPKMVYSRWYEV